MSEDKPIIAIDATELDNFETCAYKWDLFHHRHIVPKTTKSYLDKGSLLHYLLELWYKSKSPTSSEEDKNRTLEGIVEMGRVRSLEFDLTLEEIGEIIFQFREYCRFYEDEKIIPIYIEQPFTVELFEDEDIKILLMGKPDLVFRYSHSSDLIVMDHKKVSRDGPISPIRNQFLLYATAIGTETVIVNKIGFQKTKPAKDRFLRQVIIYPDELLEEWKNDVIGRAREMVLYEQINHYPRNRTSCDKWDGCWYQRFCSTRPKAREFLLGTEYIIGEKWDVGEILEKK